MLNPFDVYLRLRLWRCRRRIAYLDSVQAKIDHDLSQDPDSEALHGLKDVNDWLIEEERDKLARLETLQDRPCA